MSKSSLGHPLISILMNCYNGDTFLNEAIESVLAQTYLNWELIFWDNQSTDFSSEIIRSYNDKRIKYFYAPSHQVLGNARIEAIKKAVGKWIGILDCDDLWYPSKLQDQVEIIEEYSKQDNPIGLIYGKVMGIDTESNEKSEIGHPNYINSELPEGFLLNKLLLEGNFIMGPSILFNLNAFHEIGGFPKGFIAATDYYISCGISSKYQIKAVNKYIAKYRLHSNNLTRVQKIITYKEQISTFHIWYQKTNISLGQKKKRIRELNVFVGLMMIKYNRKYFDGIKRIVLLGSLFFCLKYVLSFFFKKLLKF